MGFRFHRALRLLPGVRLNLSKTGFSLSVGGAPFTVNWGRRGLRITASVPGTGMSYSKELPLFSRGQRGVSGAAEHRRPLD